MKKGLAFFLVLVLAMGIAGASLAAAPVNTTKWATLSALVQDGYLGGFKNSGELLSYLNSKEGTLASEVDAMYDSLNTVDYERYMVKNPLYNPKFPILPQYVPFGWIKTTTTIGLENVSVSMPTAMVISSTGNWEDNTGTVGFSTTNTFNSNGSFETQDYLLQGDSTVTETEEWVLHK